MTDDDNAERLGRLLEGLSELLQSLGESHWAGWMDQSSRLITAGQEKGRDHFLDAFGGMGSFNDLILAPGNGHRLGEDEVEAVNARLETLKSEAHDLATGLKRGLG